MNLSPGRQAAERFIFAQQMLLADIVAQGARSQAIGQRPGV
jgi:hypothetical protein